jgi:hypothetical protein
MGAGSAPIHRQTVKRGTTTALALYLLFSSTTLFSSTLNGRRSRNTSIGRASFRRLPRRADRVLNGGSGFDGRVPRLKDSFDQARLQRRIEASKPLEAKHVTVGRRPSLVGLRLVVCCAERFARRDKLVDSIANDNWQLSSIARGVHASQLPGEYRLPSWLPDPTHHISFDH